MRRYSWICLVYLVHARFLQKAREDYCHCTIHICSPLLIDYSFRRACNHASKELLDKRKSRYFWFVMLFYRIVLSPLIFSSGKKTSGESMGSMVGSINQQYARDARTIHRRYKSAKWALKHSFDSRSEASLQSNSHTVDKQQRYTNWTNMYIFVWNNRLTGSTLQLQSFKHSNQAHPIPI